MDKIAELTAYTEYLVRFGFLGVAVFLILIVAPLVQGLLKSPVATKATLATGGLFLILFGVINLIRLTFPHDVVLRCEQSTRQCCNTEGQFCGTSGACELRAIP